MTGETGEATMFEVGKTYRTRGGQTVKVTRIDRHPLFPIDGDIDGEGGAWTKAGFVVGPNDPHESDLIPGAIEDADRPHQDTPHYSVGVSPSMPPLTPPALVKTLWDEYAMAALAGLLARPQTGRVPLLEYVEDAKRYADAMMTERKRRESNDDQ